MLEPRKLANIMNTENGEKFMNSMVCHVSEGHVTFAKSNGVVMTLPTSKINEITEGETMNQEVSENNPETEVESQPQPQPKRQNMKALAEKLYEENPDATRKQVIAMLEGVGLAKNSASIYHNKIWVKARKEKQKELTGVDSESVDQPVN